MAILNDSKLDFIRTWYQPAFQDLYTGGGKRGVELYNTYVSEQPIDGKFLEIDFLSSLPIFLEWVGEKVQQAARGNSMRFEVKDWDATLGVPLKDINGDRGNVVVSQISSWLANADNLKERQAFQTLISGNLGTAITYDGVPYLSNAHPNGPLSGGVTTQSNFSTTMALTRGNVVLARASMRLYADENYEPLGIEPNILMVGPEQEMQALDIVNANMRTQAITAASVVDPGASGVAAAAIDNSLKTTGIKVVVQPRLLGSTQNYWFLMDTTKQYKPLVAGVLRQPAPFDNLSQYMVSPVALFSIQAQIAFGFGHWATCFASFQ